MISPEDLNWNMGDAASDGSQPHCYHTSHEFIKYAQRSSYRKCLFLAFHCISHRKIFEIVFMLRLRSFLSSMNWWVASQRKHFLSLNSEVYFVLSSVHWRPSWATCGPRMKMYLTPQINSHCIRARVLEAGVAYRWNNAVKLYFSVAQFKLFVSYRE